MAERAEAGPGGRPAWGRLGLGVGLLAVGGFFVVETMAIRVLPTYARVGPRFFPYMVAAGLLVLGAAITWRAWRGLDSDADPTGTERPDRVSMALVVGGLVLQSLVIDWIGFVLAATLTFMLTAAGFGSRRWLTNLGVGFLLALGSYLGFTRLLGLSLPAGILEGLL